MNAQGERECDDRHARGLRWKVVRVKEQVSEGIGADDQQDGLGYQVSEEDGVGAACRSL